MSFCYWWIVVILLSVTFTGWSLETLERLNFGSFELWNQPRLKSFQHYESYPEFELIEQFLPCKTWEILFQYCSGRLKRLSYGFAWSGFISDLQKRAISFQIKSVVQNWKRHLIRLSFMSSLHFSYRNSSEHFLKAKFLSLLRFYPPLRLSRPLQYLNSSISSCGSDVSLLRLLRFSYKFLIGFFFVIMAIRHMKRPIAYNFFGFF